MCGFSRHHPVPSPASRGAPAPGPPARVGSDSGRDLPRSCKAAHRGSRGGLPSHVELSRGPPQLASANEGGSRLTPWPPIQNLPASSQDALEDNLQGEGFISGNARLQSSQQPPPKTLSWPGPEWTLGRGFVCTERGAGELSLQVSQLGRDAAGGHPLGPGDRPRPGTAASIAPLLFWVGRGSRTQPSAPIPPFTSTSRFLAVASWTLPRRGFTTPGWPC